VREGLGGGRGGPEEARQFAGARDDGDVVWLSAGFHLSVDAMDSLLGSVGDLQDVLGLPVLAVSSVAPIRGSRAYCQADSTSSRRASPDPVFVIAPCREDSPD
jgi:hypothetical protein